MTCATAVFILMGVAAALAFAATSFYAQNIVSDLKRKLQTYNTALAHLQEERARLIVKTENMYSDNASQDVHLTHLKEENRLLRRAIERLEIDNHLLTEEYKKLGELLFENHSK